MSRHGDENTARFDDYGLSVLSNEITQGFVRRGQTRMHTHMEVEMVFIEAGEVALEFSGGIQEIRTGDVALYWGGIPHSIVDATTSTICHIAHVPMVDLLSWSSSSESVDRLLTGEYFSASSPADQVVADRLAFTRWNTDLVSRDSQARAIAELEIHGRLRRFLPDSAPPAGESALRRYGSSTAVGVANAIRYVVRNFMEHFTIEDVAEAVGWHRCHLMESFREVCGLTVWEYVTRTRLTEAKRLLAITDLPVLTICDRTGFSSTSRMYQAFHRYYQLTPSQYRKEVCQ